MRFITFSKEGVATVGVRLRDTIVDLSAAAPRLPGTIVDLVKADLLCEAYDIAKTASASAHLDPVSIDWMPVIPRPPLLFGFGINYGSHAGPRPECPGFFVSTSSRLVAHRKAMVIPKLSATLDFEVELAIVMKRGGKDISRRDALDYIAAYTIFNDGSVRGYGGGETLALMKNSDRTAPFGPEIVTPDELPSGAAGLRLITRRNGVEVQNETTNQMYWKVPEIIQTVSQYVTLGPGDVITTGTPGGTMVETAIKSGLAWSDPSIDWLKDGETIECEIEGIGVISNPVCAER
jgi:acylpyruvate hydrolase